MTDATPAQANSEKLYVVQMRAVELSERFELLFGGGQDFIGDGLLITRQISIDALYHFNDRWAIEAGYSSLGNQFNSSAQNLSNNNGIVPSVDYTLSRFELGAVYNLFYGKIRFSSDSATYFDQFIGLGASYNQQGSGPTLGPWLEIGFAHWIGNWGSLRWGLKDYYANEQSELSSGYKNNLFGMLEAGYLFR